MLGHPLLARRFYGVVLAKMISVKAAADRVKLEREQVVGLERERSEELS